MRRHPSFTLENLLLVFFLLPVIVFIVTWFQPPAALLSTLGLLLILRRVLSPPGQKKSAFPEIGPLGWAVIFLLASLWVSLSGAGGIGFQNWDHLKHNAIMNDLVLKDWPLRYHSGKRLLVYYLPYYLIPAWMGKAAGWTAANVLLWLQLLVLVALTLAWLVKKVGAQGPCVLAAVLLFILFSGNDWIGYALNKGPPRLFSHIEWWTHFNYMSATTQLFWVPNSAVAAWTGTALFLNALERHSLLRSLLVWLLTFFWCPYAAAGMLPFLLVFPQPVDGWKQFLYKDWKWALAVCPAAALAVAFYSGRSPSIHFEAVWMRFPDIRTFGIEYVEFILLHVLWAVPFIWYFRGEIRKRTGVWRLFLVACAVLSILPLAMGPGIGDFIMKGSMPSLFALAVVMITTVVQFLQAGKDAVLPHRKGRVVMGFMVVIYLFGSLTAFHEIGRGVLQYELKIPEFHHEDCVPTLKPDHVARQYIGRENGFLRFLLRDPGN